MKKTAILGAALAATLGAGAAHAADTPFYAGGFAGASFDDQHLFKGATPTGAARRIETPVKDGAYAGLTLGAVVVDADWGRVRVEGELASRQNKVEKLVLNDVQRQLIEGAKTATTTMINVAYDTPKVFDRVRFSVGAGVGHASLDYDVRYMVTANGPFIAIPTSVGVVGYQAMAGAQYDLTDRIELTTDVRYFEAGDHQVERFNHTTGALDSVLDADYSAVSVTAGARFRF